MLFTKYMIRARAYYLARSFWQKAPYTVYDAVTGEIVNPEVKE